MMKDRLLAIDPGTRRAGWALFVAGEYIRSGVVTVTNKELKWLQRLDLITLELISLCRKYSVDKVVIEEPELFIGSVKGRAASNSGSVLKLTGFVYTLRSMCVSRRMQVELIPVRKWKGSVPKHITQKRIKKHLGVEITQPDEADAVGLGLYYLRN